MCQSSKDCNKKIIFFVLVIVFSFILVPRIRAQETNYTYTAYVVKVVDGDTYDVDVDLGMNVTLKNIRIRAYGIDTPETRTKYLLEKKAGLKVSEIVSKKILNKFITITTIKTNKSKYGQYLGIIKIHGNTLNNWLVDNKLARAYLGGKKNKWEVSQLENIIDYESQ